MSANPKVTIGMPVFNGQNFIGSAIESLLTQTFTDFEIIISDNGSTDQTQFICENYATQDLRVRYFRRETNLGAISNFNSLVALARGEYFKWAAHDDMCEPTYIQRCVEILDQQPEVAWCHSDSDMIDSEGRSWLNRMPSDDEEIEISSTGKRRWSGLPRANHNASRPSKRFAGVLMGTRWCVDSYGVIRLDVLRQTGLYPSIYGAEKVLMGELSLIGPTFQIPQNLFKQRIHPEASAFKDDSVALQQFVGARDAKPFASTRLALLMAHLKVVRRSKVTVWEKFCCYVVIARYVFQLRKWIRVVLRALNGKGIGGGGRRIIEAGSYEMTRSMKGRQA